MALESLRHEQLPEVLRSEFLHVLAVVVNLPCWTEATCVRAPPHKNTNKHPQKYTYIHTYIHSFVRTQTCTQTGGGGRGGGGVGDNSSTAKHQISGEQSKRKDQNVVGGRRRAERCETAGKGVVELEMESINFKLM